MECSEGGGAAPVKVEPAGHEHVRGQVLEAAWCPEDRAACMNEETVLVKEEAVLVKQELYTDYEVQEGLVLGPVCVQKRAARSVTEVTFKLEPGSVAEAKVKEEPECGSETAGWREREAEQQTQHSERQSEGGARVWERDCRLERETQHSERQSWPTLNGVTVQPEPGAAGEAHVKEPECGSETAGSCGRETARSCGRETAGSCGRETARSCRSKAEQLTRHSERQSWPTLTIEPIGGPGRPPTECFVCSKQFKEPSKLKEHIRAHTGEKPYPCKTCEKRFTRNSVLKVHERTHTGERPFCCEICNRRFTDSRSLKIHDLIHTRKPYPCDVCDRKFADPDTLRKHTFFHIRKEFAQLRSLK